MPMTVFSDGAFVAPLGAADAIEVINPATEQVLDVVPAGTAADVDRAVAAARRAFPGWAATPAAARGAVLAAARDALARRADEVALLVTREVGTPLAVSRAVQVGLPVTVLGDFAELAAGLDGAEERIGSSVVIREPAGVVGAITPWNYPLHQVVAKVGAALAAGCSVVLKPSEVAPLSAYALCEIFADAGLPPGVLNLVSGTGPDVGAALAGHPDIDLVSFTGSTRAGAQVAAAAAAHITRVALELGGKSANVVLDDADLTKAVKVGVANCFLNAGQTCTAWTRLVVPADRYDEAVDLAVASARGYLPADPEADGTRLGPLASAAQRDRVQGHVSAALAAGARAAAGGVHAVDAPTVGYYVPATVLAGVTPDMAVAREEVFGPVLSVLAYRTEDEALTIANGTDYGLAGGVWSADPDRAEAFARGMRTGQVDINGARFNPRAPFGGYRRSGVGRELGPHGLAEMQEVKSLQR